MSALIVWLLATQVEAPGYVAQLFDRSKYNYQASDGATVKIPYATFSPQSIEPGKKYPLIVWLHGAGQRGTNNRAQLRHIDETLMPRAEEDDYPVFILAPQAPRGLSWHGDEPGTMATVTPSDGRSDMLDVVIALIEEMVKTYPIDTDRVILIGLSSGGTAAWEMAGRFPGRFAAVMPFGSNPRHSLPLQSLARTKIWSFHSPIDKIAPVVTVEEMVQRMRSFGAKAALTYDCDNPSLDDVDGNHFCFAGPFVEYDLFNWILSQKRGSNSPDPAEIVWASRLRWDYLRSRLLNASPILAGAIVIIAIFREIRMRNSRAAQHSSNMQSQHAATTPER